MGRVTSESGQERSDRSAVRQTEDAVLRSLADVAMVQAADFGELHDPFGREDLDRPEIGRVLVEREVGTRPMVIAEVAGQDAAEVSLAENEYVVTHAGSSR